MTVAIPSPSTAPQSAQLSTLQRQVIMYILAPDDPDALEAAKEGLNDAIDTLNERKWYWGVTYQDITLVADDDDYPLEPTYKQAYAAILRDSTGRRTRLVYADPKNFWEKYPTVTNSGTPCGYTVINANDILELQLSRPPTSSFVSRYTTLRFFHYQRIEKFANEGDTIAVPPEVMGYLKWYAKKVVAATFDMATKARLAGQESDKRFKALVKDHNEHHESDWAHSEWATESYVR